MQTVLVMFYMALSNSHRYPSFSEFIISEAIIKTEKGQERVQLWPITVFTTYCNAEEE